MSNATKAFTAQTRIRSVSLLLVEDNDDHWQLARAAFTKIAPRVTITRVTSGEQAFRYLVDRLSEVETLPGLVLTNLYLPTPALGWRLLERIKQYGSPLDQLPVVVLSHSDSAGDIVRSYQQGARACLIKPTRCTDWVKFIERISTYWLNTVTLPKLNLLF